MAYITVRFSDEYNANTGDVSGSVIGAKRADPAANYGYALGGVTMGILNDAGLGAAPSSGWATGDTSALRGRWRRGNDLGIQSFRIDVTPGDYRVILGSSANSYQRSRWRVLDGSTPTPIDVSWSSNAVFWADDEAPTPADQWIDQNGVVRPIGTDHLVATPTVVTISSGQLVILNGGHPGGAFSSDLSFIAWELVAGGGGGGPVASRRRRLLMS